MNAYAVKMEKSHEKALSHIRGKDNTPNNVWRTIDVTCTELVLHYAGYCCEGCATEEQLTIHHLVQRPNKEVMDFGKYARARHNFRNQVLLCISCHGKAEMRIWNERADNNDPVFTKTRINEIRKKFGD